MITLGLDSDISELLIAFDENRDETLSAIYTTYRDRFISFGKKFSEDEEFIIDAFQEAVISLYENLKSNRVTVQESTIKTYLFAIGKNKILNALKKKKNHETFMTEQVSITHHDPEENEDQKSLLSTAFNALGSKCQDVLIKFYYERFSVEAIMIAMDYSNENTVKAHKSRCISQLRKILKAK